MRYVDIDDIRLHAPRAFARGGQRHAASDALGRAGDDHDLVLEAVGMDHAAPPVVLAAANFSK
jgi:hypothetical protein